MCYKQAAHEADLPKSFDDLICTCLSGCGGGFPSGLPVGFINQTQHSDADLWAIWKTAQKELAQQVDLNPLQQSLYDAPREYASRRRGH
jgi:cell shape-determining protein MreC